jgi:hypothetical protein
MTAPSPELQPHQPVPATDFDDDERTTMNTIVAPESEVPAGEKDVGSIDEAVDKGLAQVTEDTKDTTLVAQAELSAPEKSRLKEIWAKMREATTNFFQKIKGIFGKEEIPDVTDALEDSEEPIKPIQSEAFKDAEKIYFMTEREPGKDQVLIDDEGRQIHFYDPENPNAVEVSDPSGIHSGKGTISIDGKLTRVHMEGQPFFFTVGEGKTQATNVPVPPIEEVPGYQKRPVADTGVKPPPTPDISLEKEVVQQPAAPTTKEQPTARVSNRERAKIKNPEDHRQFLDTRLQAAAKFSEQFIQQLDALGLSRAQNREIRQKFINGQIYDQDFEKLLDFQGGSAEKHNAAVQALQETYLTMMRVSNTPYQEGLRFNLDGTQHSVEVKDIPIPTTVEEVPKPAAAATPEPAVSSRPEIEIDVDKVEPREMPAAATTDQGFGQDRLIVDNVEDDDAGGTVEEPPSMATSPDNVENLDDHRKQQESATEEPTKEEFKRTDSLLEQEFNNRKKELLSDEQLKAIPAKGDFSQVKFAYHRTNRELVITDPVGNYLTHLDKSKTEQLLNQKSLKPENLRKFTKAYGEEEIKAEAA